MTLTRLRPFGQHRKTYFYGVAGFVLAAHVVIGGIVHMIPPALDEQAPRVGGVEMQIVDRLLPGEAIETGAVELIENSPEPAVPEPELPAPEPVPEPIEAPLDFDPVWQAESQPQALAPDTEPIGPTLTDLPPLIVLLDDELDDQIDAAEEKKETSTPPEVKAPAPAVAKTTPKPAPKPAPKPKSSQSSRESTTSAPRRTVTKTIPTSTPAPPRAVPRAIPTNNRPPERTGILDRLRDRRERD